MLIIQSISSDPYFNLAMEEYLLKETKEEFFLTYINEPSIIVGKHQNAYAEINLDFVRKYNLKVARRLTGGGTVFHDSGNLNFSFIVNGKEGQLVDFKKHTKPIIDFLETLSVRAEFAGKNDLLMDGLKISGNAEHVFRNRVLHHGTLLVDAKLSSLSEALKVNPAKYTDKAVRSIRSKVANITDNIKEPIGIDQLRDQLTNFIRKEKGATGYGLTEQDADKISAIRDQKFATWEWNFGYAPKYTLIKNASVEGDLFSESCTRKINKALTDIPHHFDQILEILKQFPDKTCFK